MEAGWALIFGGLIALIVVVIVAPIVAIYRENGNLTIRRGRFALWVLLYLIVAPTVVNVVAEILPDIAGYAIVAIIGAVVTYLFYQRVVRRARDAGKGKRIAYVGVIPIANLVVFVILMIVRSASSGEDARTADA